ncbi:hypothetical protein NDU88_002716 [Pleurodeles waltl]|uniref:Uncharacterized protein n=1 Tax=Pleurodeles waltl TaxID=8319 RepID=A0AAV7TMQ3_PLEWA|nr:hypothetical protein NDU88_002716 [Pleurodeles waltl]
MRFLHGADRADEAARAVEQRVLDIEDRSNQSESTIPRIQLEREDLQLKLDYWKIDHAGQILDSLGSQKT